MLRGLVREAILSGRCASLMSKNFDPHARIYDATRTFSPGSQKVIVDSIVRSVCATRGSRFLELGVGTGRFALPIVRRGYRLTGIDISENMLRNFRGKLRHSGLAARLLKADAGSLPFADGVFDVVMAMLVLHWMPDFRKTLSETRRVLRGDGCLVFYNGRPRSANINELNDEDGLTEVDIAWQRILNAYRGDRPAEVASETDILEALHQMGAKIETKEVGKWVRKITPRETIARLKTRSFSEDRDLPRDDFIRLVSQLEKWCRERFESMEVVLHRRRKFRYHVIRFAR
ncbi:MAG: class I SAM-dependent methyltransferase [Gammaproteobacteria bacterium]|nr:class I SAM-dependent methyltransferase [Gammaproteobacteria bacterium]